MIQSERVTSGRSAELTGCTVAIDNVAGARAAATRWFCVAVSSARSFPATTQTHARRWTARSRRMLLV